MNTSPSQAYLEIYGVCCSSGWWEYLRNVKQMEDSVLFKAVCWPVHRRVIELPQCDNATQCSSALPLPAESPATEQEVGTGWDGALSH